MYKTLPLQKERVDCEAACHCKEAVQTSIRIKFQEETDLENVVAYMNQLRQ